MNDNIEIIHGQSVDLKNREIYLHGQHGSFEEDPGVEYRMATTFIKNIRCLDGINDNSILVHMHSVGGNWSDGMAIYDSIAACKSHVTILTYGQAESMSSIILQAADLRIMMPNAYFMCHYGSSGWSQDYLSAQNAAKFEQRIADTMFTIYAEHCLDGQFFAEHYKTPTTDKVKAFLKRKLKSGDWYLDAQGTVRYGFADGILGDGKYRTINNLK